ncbi:MAG: isochorismatase family protein [Aeromicrobium sp.]
MTINAFGGDIGWGQRPALLLIDMCKAYFQEGSPLNLPDHSSAHAAERLLTAARRTGVPVLHTRVVYRPGMVDAGHFFSKVGALQIFSQDADPEPGQFVPALEPLPEEAVIVKQYASGFFGTSLASTLAAMGVDTLVIGGVSTSGCVRATTTDAVQHGFRPMLVPEACGDRTPEYHDSNVRDLGAKYADVMTSDAVIARFEATR